MRALSLVWDYEEFWHKTGLRNATDRTFHYADWDIPSLTKAVCHVGQAVTDGQKTLSRSSGNEG